MLHFFLLLFSCNKESLRTTIDQVPEVPVIEEIVPDEDDTPTIVDIASGKTALSTFVFDTVSMQVNNYSLVIPSSFIGAPEAVWAGVWSPPTPEQSLQATTYVIETVSIISEAGIDVYEEWIANGSDPTTEPDIFDYEKDYVVAGLNCTISNITDTTADVEIMGNLIDEFGGMLPVSGAFVADLYSTP